MADYSQLLFGFLPSELLAIFTDAYVETGNDDLALQTVRASAAYETYYPANRRADGTVRFSEAQYSSYRDLYDKTFASFNLNPALFSQRFTDLVVGDVSPDEFISRMDSAYERVVASAPAIRQFYASSYGLELTDQAIFASVLDPKVNQAIINRQIDVAEVGGEAALRGFGLTTNFAEDLVRRGIRRPQAQEQFTQAAAAVPILDVLARRHFDPDDDFDLNEFLAQSIFDDQEQRQRVRRLLSQEKSSFSPTGGYAASQTGGLAITPR